MAPEKRGFCAVVLLASAHVRGQSTAAAAAAEIGQTFARSQFGEKQFEGGGEIDCMRASFYDLRRERERELKVSKRKIVNYSLLNLTVCFYSRFWSGAKQHVAFGAKPLQLHGK